MIRHNDQTCCGERGLGPLSHCLGIECLGGGAVLPWDCCEPIGQLSTLYSWIDLGHFGATAF